MADPVASIVLIEDDAQIRRFLRATLAGHGYRLYEATTAADGLEQVARERPAAVLLDLGLPDLDGLEVTQRLREWTDTPIIVISARGQERDKVAALDAGADDYVTKPFGVAELQARLRVALRHAQARLQPAGEPVFTIGTLSVDTVHRRVCVDGHEVHLTPIEYNLLGLLVRYAGRVVTQRQLLKEVWGPAYVDDSQTLRVHMSQLRHKLETNPARPRYLLTEPGVGYRLKAD
jgi:two-component system, OmpR family, KDP operon response regulator KdpE